MKSSLSGNEPGLLAYYDFNTGIAEGNNKDSTILYDRTPGGKNGTLLNFALTGTTSNWVKGVPLSDGTSAASAGESAFAIKRDSPFLTDGYYWIKNPNINGGEPFQIYADMTTDGGWTLIMCNRDRPGWTFSNTISRNTNAPSITTNYSIIGWADFIKKSPAGFQYMIDANARRSYGGIWTANENYTFTKNNNSQTNVTLDTKFGTWDYHDSGIEQRMPWYSNCSGALTTRQICNGGAWWGTLIAVNQPNRTPAPWINSGGGSQGCMPNPGVIWYWVR